MVGISVSLIASIMGLVQVLLNGAMHYYLGGWIPPIGIEYVLDHLSAFMAVLITFIAFLSMIYSRSIFLKDMPDKIVPLYSLLLLLMAGLAGIVVTGDLFNVYVFLEIASLAAYAVMAIGSQKAPVAVIRYVIIGTLGACFYLLGVGFLYFSTGSLNMADVATADYFSRGVHCHRYDTKNGSFPLPYLVAGCLYLCLFRRGRVRGAAYDQGWRLCFDSDADLGFPSELSDGGLSDNAGGRMAGGRGHYYWLSNGDRAERPESHASLQQHSPNRLCGAGNRPG
jgi:hypothetical protein